MPVILAQRPSYYPDLARMKERHHEIKRRMVAGDRLTDIAKDMGVTNTWLSIVTSSPLFQAELQELRAQADQNAADISSRIKRLAPAAMDVLERVVRGTKKQDGTYPVEGMSVKDHAKFALEALALGGHQRPLSATPAQGAVRIEIVQFNAPGAVAPQVQATQVTIDGSAEPDKESA